MHVTAAPLLKVQQNGWRFPLSGTPSAPPPGTQQRQAVQRDARGDGGAARELPRARRVAGSPGRRVAEGDDAGDGAGRGRKARGG
jgi:hypothetical protein